MIYNRCLWFVVNYVTVSYPFFLEHLFFNRLKSTLHYVLKNQSSSPFGLDGFSET